MAFANATRVSIVLLLLGLVGNVVLLGYVVYDDPASLWWVGGLLADGVVLYLVESVFGSSDRPEGVDRGDPTATLH